MNENTRLIINRILSILSGVVAGVIIISLVEWLSTMLYPTPENVNFADKEALKSYINTLPVAALLIIIFAHAAGALAGGFVTAYMAKIQKNGAAISTGLILMVAGLLNLVSIPHPIWFSITDVIVYVPMAFLGGKLVSFLIKT